MNLLFQSAQMAQSLRERQELEFWTTCGADDQFSSPKQIRWSAALGKLLVANNSAGGGNLIRNADLSFYDKYFYHATSSTAVDSDANNIYVAGSGTLYKRYNYSPYANTGASIAISSVRMIDASGDADYVYYTSNQSGNQRVGKITKATMTEDIAPNTTGSGAGWTSPLGIKKIGNFVYVCDNMGSASGGVIKLNASDLSYVETVKSGDYLSDIDFDGTNWFATTYTVGRIYKYDSAWGNRSYIAHAGAYSICCVGDNIAITDNTNSHLALYAKSNLAQVGSDVGSSGDGSASLFNPAATCVGGGTWYTDDGRSYYAASGAAPSQNGFTGIFWESAGPHRATFRPAAGGLAAATALDANSDLVRQDIKNIYKCVNLTSLKLQTNTSLLLNLGRLTSKLVTIWAYACGAGISGSIRHMTAATSINLRENGASQAQVDAWIADLYANRESMAPGTVNLNGTNSAPSAAGKAQADELVADYSWSITYTL